MHRVPQPAKAELRLEARPPDPGSWVQGSVQVWLHDTTWPYIQTGIKAAKHIQKMLANKTNVDKI